MGQRLGGLGLAALIAAILAAPPLVPGQDETAPYLDKDRKIEIFDPPQAEKLDPIRKAVERLLEPEANGRGRSLADIQNLVTYDFTLEGENEAAILERARVRALKSSAARLYFENYYLLGRDLLEPYLKIYGERFIPRLEISERRILANGHLAMRVRLSVNQDAFYRDLREKRFVAKPNIRPIAAVLLREVIEGRPDTSANGRMRIEQTMKHFLFRVFSRKMRQPGLDVDLSGEPELLKTARLEAQRNGVDVLLSGTLTVNPIRSDQVLFDDYEYQEAELDLKMYRVDNGELLAQIKDRYSAAAGQREEAIAEVLDALMERATRRLAESLREMWGNTMLEEANFRLMFSGVDAARLANVTNVLRAVSPDLKLYQKAYYGDVLVVNVALPADAAAGLETFLRESTEPQFNVIKVDERRFELDIL